MRLHAPLLLAAAVLLLPGVNAHIQLAHPRPVLNSDFLDTFRTTGLCGLDSSGNDLSGIWKLPPVQDITTTVEAGSRMNVTWNLHYAHQGGWRLRLYNVSEGLDNAEQLAAWEDDSHWGCSADGAQQWTQIEIPEIECPDCVLRLERQALEWGRNYIFRSCAPLAITTNPDPEACLLCNGNGRCTGPNNNVCECFNNAEQGFWEGTHCERENECDVDADCGSNGACLDIGALSPPRKQCYCQTGWWGPEVTTVGGLSSRRCDRPSSLELGDPATWPDEYPARYASTPDGNLEVFFKVDEQAQEIEFAIMANTTNWVGIGFRPAANASAPIGAPAEAGEASAGAAAEGETEAEAEGEGDGDHTHDGGEADGEAEGEPAAEGETEAEADGEGDGDHTHDDGEAEAEGEGDGDHTHDDGEADGEAEGEPAAEGETEAEADGEGDGDHTHDDGEAEAEGEGDGDHTHDDGEAEGEPAAEGEADGEEDQEEAAAAGEGEEAEAEGEGEAAESVGEAEAEADGEGTEMEYEGEMEDGKYEADGPAAEMEYEEGEGEAGAEGEGEAGAEGEGEAGAEGEGEAGAEGEGEAGAEGEGEAGAEGGTEAEGAENDFCPTADMPPRPIRRPTVSLSGAAVAAQQAANRVAAAGRRLLMHGRSFTPRLEREAASSGSAHAWLKRILLQSESAEAPAAAAEGAAAPEPEAVAEPGTGAGAAAATASAGPDAFGSGACLNRLVNQRAHPMINQDIVMMYARENYVRVVDSFTPSRSRPLPDSEFGGVDDIVDAVGMETPDGITMVKFRRPLLTADSAADYCLYDDIIYQMIWAYGQQPGRIVHDPQSALEVNLSSNPNFYAQDELKFHGGGINIGAYDGRGSFGLVNIVEAGEEVEAGAAGAACDASTIEGFDCMQETIPQQHSLHWTVQDTGVRFAVEGSTAGWVSVAWPETLGVMTPADAVICWMDASGEATTGVFELQARAEAGIVPSTAFEITDAEVEETADGRTICRFTRAFDDAFQPVDGNVDLNVAISTFGTDGISYHGAGRGGASVPLFA